MRICKECKHARIRYHTSDFSSGYFANCLIEEAPKEMIEIDFVTGKTSCDDNDYGQVYLSRGLFRSGVLKYLKRCDVKNADGKCKDWVKK